MKTRICVLIFSVLLLSQTLVGMHTRLLSKKSFSKVTHLFPKSSHFKLLTSKCVLGGPSHFFTTEKECPAVKKMVMSFKNEQEYFDTFHIRLEFIQTQRDKLFKETKDKCSVDQMQTFMLMEKLQIRFDDIIKENGVKLSTEHSFFKFTADELANAHKEDVVITFKNKLTQQKKEVFEERYHWAALAGFCILNMYMAYGVLC